MREQRISVRISDELLSVGARVSTDSGVSWTAIYVKDISDSGMGFVAEKHFSANELLELEGSVSDYMRHIDIGCEMKIVFTGSTTDGKTLYGGKFMNMGKTQKTELAIFIERMVTKFPPLMLQ